MAFLAIGIGKDRTRTVFCAALALGDAQIRLEAFVVGGCDATAALVGAFPIVDASVTARIGVDFGAFGERADRFRGWGFFGSSVGDIVGSCFACACFVGRLAALFVSVGFGGDGDLASEAQQRRAEAEHHKEHRDAAVSQEKG